MVVQEHFSTSAAFQFITSRGWDWDNATDPNIQLKVCPYCKKDGYGHFYIELHGSSSEFYKRDGLHLCHRCGKSGSLYSLKTHVGAVIPGVSSRSEWAGAERKIDTLPDTEASHEALLEDSEVMEYLTVTRGFSKDIIKKQKLGIVDKKYFKSCGEVKALVYPYLVGGNTVFVHYRTLPPSPKDFSSPRGWEVPLYNGEVLKEGLKEIVLVEGEANVISALDHGIENICGVPGANIKKAEWIDTLDKLELEKIYICYDKDKVGQKAAQTLASRIGIEKCYKVQLPDFEVETAEGTRKGKDLNEYFQHGYTKEDFSGLLTSAKQFDVDGVIPPSDALTELEDMINGRGLTPQYTTRWNSLNKFVGFDDGDVIDIIAPAKIGKTTFAMNLVEHMVDKYGDDGVIICLEMTTVKLARKWVAHISGIEDNIPNTPEAAEKLKEDFLAGIKMAKKKVAERDGDLYFCFPKYKKMDDLYKLIIDIIRRYGVKWIVFDNMQRACDTTIGGKNRTQHLSEISKVLSQIAKEYNVQLVRIVQPHAIKVGQLTSAEDADGSSQISKDCDATIILDRTRLNPISKSDFDTLGFVESEAAFDDKLFASVGLSRYSGGGYTTLRYDGARSTIYEYDSAEVEKIKADLERGLGHEAKFEELTADRKEEITL